MDKLQKTELVRQIDDLHFYISWPQYFNLEPPNLCPRPSSYSQPGYSVEIWIHGIFTLYSKMLTPALSLRAPTSHVKMQYFQVCMVLAINIIGISLNENVYFSSEDNYILNLSNEIKGFSKSTIGQEDNMKRHPRFWSSESVLMNADRIWSKRNKIRRKFLKEKTLK